MNMTELLSDEIRRIRKTLSKKPSSKGHKKIDFKKLFPLLKYNKVKR